MWLFVVFLAFDIASVALFYSGDEFTVILVLKTVTKRALATKYTYASVLFTSLPDIFDIW